MDSGDVRHLCFSRTGTTLSSINSPGWRRFITTVQWWSQALVWKLFILDIPEAITVHLFFGCSNHSFYGYRSWVLAFACTNLRRIKLFGVPTHFSSPYIRGSCYGRSYHIVSIDYRHSIVPWCPTVTSTDHPANHTSHIMYQPYRRCRICHP